MRKLYPLALLVIFIGLGCGQKKADDNTASLSTAKDSIAQLTANTAKIISAKGPIGWLDVFENSPDFYMVNDGFVAFKNYKTAEKFIRDTLRENLQHVELKFSNIRVTALSPESGSVGAAYNEILSFTKGTPVTVRGYFTATAHHTPTGWKFINLHWSGKK